VWPAAWIIAVEAVDWGEACERKMTKMKLASGIAQLLRQTY
jgi:hypothetical protein